MPFRSSGDILTINIHLQVASVEEGLEMASRNNARHLQVSAQSGMNVEAAFRILVEDILATQEFECAADEKRKSARRRRSSAIGF